MGTQIRCKKCSQVLAEFNDVPNDVIWYSHLRNKIRGTCSNCGHKLPTPLQYAQKMRIEVNPVPCRCKIKVDN